MPYYHLTSQYPYGCVLIFSLGNKTATFFTVSHLSYHSLCLGSNEDVPSICLK